MGLVLSSCQSSPAPTLPSELVPSHRLSGRILLQHLEEKHSGELDLLLRGEQVRLQIFAPILGTLLYELRADSERLQVLNHRDRRYWSGANTEAHRRQWVGMDLTFSELQALLQGQVPLLSQTEGVRQVSPEEPVVVTQGAVRFEGWHDDDHLTRVVKYLEELPEYEVTFLSYSEEPKPLPRRLRIEDEVGLSRIVLALTRSEKTVGLSSPIDFSIPEGLEPFAVPSG